MLYSMITHAFASTCSIHREAFYSQHFLRATQITSRSISKGIISSVVSVVVKMMRLFRCFFLEIPSHQALSKKTSCMEVIFTLYCNCAILIIR